MDTTNFNDFEALETIDLKNLFDLLRRRFWALALGLLLGAGAAALFSYFQEPVYQASTKVLVTVSKQNQSTDIAGTATLQQTAETYVQFLTMEPVRKMVSERVAFKVADGAVQARLVPNTQIIDLTVEDTDPQRAALIADTLVQVLIEQNEILQAGRYADSEASLNVQIAEMEKQINSLQDELEQANADALKSQLASIQTQMDDVQAELIVIENKEELTPEESLRKGQLQSLMTSYQTAYANLLLSGKVQIASEEVTRLEKRYNLYQQLYLNLLSNLESVRMARLQNTPTVVQVSPALVGDTPIRPRPLLNTLLGGLAGLVLATGLVFLIEFLDDTVKTPEDIERLLGLTVLGYVAEVNNGKSRHGQLNVAEQPRSPIAEAFRSLRANLEFSGIDHPLRTILVTSSGPGEGKSTIAMNLASIMAQAGKHVTLLDADLRRPAIHSFFDLTNRVGLTDVFRDRLSLATITHVLNGNQKISVITTGSLPPNPTELLASEKMDTILAELKATDTIVVLDSAPAIVSDAQVLSSKVDGVLLVVLPGRTHEDELRATHEQLKRAGAHILGVVFNRIPQNRTSYYGGYKQYSPYHYRSYQYTSSNAPDHASVENVAEEKDQPRK